MILVNGALAAYLARAIVNCSRFSPTRSRIDSKAGRAVARVLIDRARTGGEAPRGMLIEEIDGLPPPHHFDVAAVLTGYLSLARWVFQATFRRAGAG